MGLYPPAPAPPPPPGDVGLYCGEVGLYDGEVGEAEY